MACAEMLSYDCQTACQHCFQNFEIARGTHWLKWWREAAESSTSNFHPLPKITTKKVQNANETALTDLSPDLGFRREVRTRSRRSQRQRLQNANVGHFLHVIFRVRAHTRGAEKRAARAASPLCLRTLCVLTCGHILPSISRVHA